MNTVNPKSPLSYAYELARAEWVELLGNENVLGPQATQERYGANTEGLHRPLTIALYLQNSVDVSEAMKIANKYRIPVYPISTGKNWGYGTAIPTSDYCVIFDLSRMNRIVSFDREMGVITLEPGVTQAQLHGFLSDNKHSFLTPVTGAGPLTSIVANALERGYGITPISDHFQAVMSIKAVLPDGTLYESFHAESGGTRVDKLFKWGIGPYLEGIFSQSNLAIVTEATIALHPKPEKIVAFFFKIRKDANLGKVVECVRDLTKEVGSNISSINLMNDRRVMAKIASTRLESGQMKKVPGVPDWMGVGCIYANARMARAVEKTIRQRLKKHTSSLCFFTLERLKHIQKLLSLLPRAWTQNVLAQLKLAILGVENMHGVPNEVSLSLCYSRTGRKPHPELPIDPARDKCGLIWYTPLVPMDGRDTAFYVQMVRRVCQRHGIAPLVTLTSLSHRCWDSSVPILFDASDAEEVRRAKACYDDLYTEGMRHGYVPYRMGSNAMHKLTQSSSAFFTTVQKIKTALDENNVLAPKRYSK